MKIHILNNNSDSGAEPSEVLEPVQRNQIQKPLKTLSRRTVNCQQTGLARVQWAIDFLSYVRC